MKLYLKLLLILDGGLMLSIDRQATFEDFKTLKMDLRVPLLLYNDKTEAILLSELITAKHRTYLLNVSHDIKALKCHVEAIHDNRAVNNIIFIFDYDTAKEIKEYAYLKDKLKFRDFFRIINKNMGDSNE